MKVSVSAPSVPAKEMGSLGLATSTSFETISDMLYRKNEQGAALGRLLKRREEKFGAD